MAGCGFNAMPPFQITAGSNWYAEGKITSCTSPAPDSCNFSVDLQELVNNEWNGPEWVTVAACSPYVGPCVVGYLQTTPKYTYQSTLVYNQFRTESILIVAIPGGTGSNEAISGTKTIPCE